MTNNQGKFHMLYWMEKRNYMNDGGFTSTTKLHCSYVTKSTNTCRLIFETASVISSASFAFTFNFCRKENNVMTDNTLIPLRYCSYTNLLHVGFRWEILFTFFTPLLYFFFCIVWHDRP